MKKRIIRMVLVGAAIIASTLFFVGVYTNGVQIPVKTGNPDQSCGFVIYGNRIYDLQGANGLSDWSGADQHPINIACNAGQAIITDAKNIGACQDSETAIYGYDKRYPSSVDLTCYN